MIQLNFKIILTLLYAVVLSCTSNHDTHIQAQKNNNVPIHDTQTKEPLKKHDSISITRPDEDSFLEFSKFLKSRDSILYSPVYINVRSTSDSTIQFPFDMKVEYSLSQPVFGLLDINDDGYLDLICQYYGLNGTGEKNLIDVYEYNNETKSYNDSCWTLWNPSFYYDQGILTEYYYGLGGGGASKYRIKDGQIRLIERIHMDITYENQKFLVYYEFYTNNLLDTISLIGNRIKLPNEYGYRKFIKK